MKVCEEIKEAWNALACGFIMLQFLISISYITGPNLRFRCDKLDGAWGGSQSFEVLKCRGLHLVVTVSMIQNVG